MYMYWRNLLRPVKKVAQLIVINTDYNTVQSFKLHFYSYMLCKCCKINILTSIKMYFFNQEISQLIFFVQKMKKNICSVVTSVLSKDKNSNNTCGKKSY